MIRTALLAACTLLSGRPGSLGPAAKTPVKVSAWFVFDGGPSMVALKADAYRLSTISAEWIVCDMSGHAVRRPHPTAEEKAALLAVTRPHHIPVLALAANTPGGDFSAASVEKFLASEARMRIQAGELVNIVSADGIDGIDLDYESLNAKDREPFAQFVQILAHDCHARHLLLAIALHPKDSEPGTWDGAQAQDWKAIGKVVDFARVMTYDEHWDSSEAGPVSSPDWAARIVNFATTVIPPQKIDLGVPGYGYDWVGKKGKDVDWNAFNALAKRHGPARRDRASSELTLSYANHTVFYPDATCASIKYQLAASLGIHGIAIWRLGLEDPGMWAVFR